jgi:hypothetical protein
VPGTTDQPAAEFTIGHLFSVLVATCAIFVYPLAMYRQDLTEVGDRFLVMAIVCTAVLVFLLLQLLPQFYDRIRTTLGAKVVLLILLIVFLGLGFREEDLFTDFRGFDTTILVGIILFVFVRDIWQKTVARNITKPIMILLSVYVLFMALDVILINVSLTDNFYIINDMLSPLTSLKSYTDYIPGYVNLYQHFPRILDFVGITKYPQLTINIIYVFFQFMCIATIALAVQLNYRFMVKQSFWVAVISTVPLFIFASRPFWDYTNIYYALPLYFYSLIPVRLFAILSVGSLCIWFMRKVDTFPQILLYGFLSGVISSIGIYQCNDFGLFAAIALGTAILFQPLQLWRNRIQLAIVYVLSTLIGLGVLLVLNTDLATLNTDYLYLWIRGSVSGYGAMTILFPGNGLMFIIVIIALLLCTLKLYLLLQRNKTTYNKDPLMANHYAILVYMATVSGLGMSYYINHSVVSFQGTSMYINLSITFFLFHQFLLRMSAQQSTNAGHTVNSTIHYSNFTPQIFVLLPIIIALLYTPVYNRVFQDGMPIKKIIYNSPTSMVDTPEYNELQIGYLNNVHKALEPLQMKVAFVGAFANIVELYTHIPAASVLTYPAAVEIGEPILNLYCQHIEHAPYDIFMINQYTPHCENLLYMNSQTLNAVIYVRKDMPITHPKEWKQLRNNFCPADLKTGEIDCTLP